MFTIKWDNKKQQFFVAAGKSNCVAYTDFQDNRENAQALADMLNGTNVGQPVKCKNCHRYFFLLDSEKEWYRDNEYELPKRCRTCRKLRRRYGLDYDLI